MEKDEFQDLVERADQGDIFALERIRKEFKDKLQCNMLKQGPIAAIAKSFFGPGCILLRYQLELETERLRAKLNGSGLEEILREHVATAYANQQVLQVSLATAKGTNADLPTQKQLAHELDLAKKQLLRAVRALRDVQTKW